MKTIIVISVLAVVAADKLDRTYLPPRGAQSSGGSGNILQTPNLSGQSQNFRSHGPTSNIGRTNHFNTNQPTDESFGRTQANFGTFQAPTTYDRTNDFARRRPSAAGPDSNNDNVVDAAFNDIPSEENRPERPQAALDRSASILRQDSENDGESYSYTYETENGIYAEESGVATNGVEAQGGFSYTGDDGQVYSIRYTADANGFVPQGDHLPTAPPVPEEILRALEQNAADEAAGIFDDGSYDATKYGDNNEEANQYGSGRIYQENDDAVVVNSADFVPLNSRNDDRTVFKNSRPGFRAGSKPSNRYLPSREGDAGNRQQNFNPRKGYQY